MDIQAAIDALPAGGGIINIPVGAHPGPVIQLTKHYVILQGQGWGTRIPFIRNGSGGALEGIFLRDLYVDGSVSDNPDYYSLDWRNIKCGGTHNVKTTGGTYGLVCSEGNSLYNEFRHSFFNGSVCGAEFYNGANSNALVNCKLSGPHGLHVISCNGISMSGGALEHNVPNMVFKQITNDDGSTKAFGVRQECAGQSSTYWSQ